MSGAFLIYANSVDGRCPHLPSTGFYAEIVSAR